MADYPALPLWTDAYLADTTHLSDDEHGRYLMMLFHMWRMPEKRFPNDDAWLARKLGRSSQDIENLYRPLIREFFKNDGNWITHKRLAREWERLSGKSKQRSEAAKSRWGKQKVSSKRNASPHGSRNATTTTTITTTKDSTESSLRSDSDAPAPNGADPSTMDLDAILYARGKALLGQSAGGQITRLKRKLGTYQALGVIEQAKRKDNPAEYVAGAIHRRPDKERDVDLDEIGRRVEARLRTGHV